MSQLTKHELSFDEWDEARYPRPETTDFDRVVETALSRRGFLSGLLVLGSAAACMGAGSVLAPVPARAMDGTSRFAFKAIPVATDATIHVPEGYEWKAVAKWGQPLFPGVADLDQATGGDAAHAERSVGENTDGMESFVIGGRQVIAVNHEYANPEVNLPNRTGGVPVDAADILKLQNVQGVAVFEVAEGPDGWAIVTDSPLNRRITHNTPMRISGPAAGHDLLKTAADADGMTALGTLNNCGSGKTPWGTFLTCEENFNGYFGSTDAAFAPTAEMKRYGVGNEDWGYHYYKFDPRFDISKTPNEPNRHGYVVEIDPSDPASVPVKRTALGRFKHENAAVVIARDGRVVVYLGDDERAEFIYKYVSNGIYVPGSDTSGLLDDGRLYAAKFLDNGSGLWIELNPQTTGGMTPAEIAIHTRIAASRAGATTMDRPEWVAVNPVAVEAYCCLTNNINRGVKPNAGGDAAPVDGPNPREKNQYGQIVRWYPANEDHADPVFNWDLFVMAGNPKVKDGAYAGSSNINEGNMFNSPDAAIFDSTGLLWIQTDGDDSNAGDFEGQGNNQMLAGDPATGRIERFLTGPKGSEVTGLCWSADRRTMFVGIQHPAAPFPDGEGMLPRSAIVAVRRADNLPVG